MALVTGTAFVSLGGFADPESDIRAQLEKEAWNAWQLEGALGRVGQGLWLADDWMRYAETLSEAKSPTAPGDADAVVQMVLAEFDVNETSARALVDRLGLDGTWIVVQIRKVHRSTDLDSRAKGQLLAQWAQALKLEMAQPGMETKVIENDVLCLDPVGYADNAGSLCITGEQDASYTWSYYGFGTRGGLFIDLGGNDTYSAYYGSFAYNDGVFIDLAGDDSYDSTYYSFAAQTENTIEVAQPYGAYFIDLSGDDVYDSSYYSFAWGAGTFMDLDGADTYACSAYYCFGANTGAASPGSNFIEVGGDDVYTGGSSNSFGFNLGGSFIEIGGDDTYNAPYISSSFGYGPGGIFLDAVGDDTYDVAYFSLGSNTGHFIDLSGNDDYSAYYYSFGYTSGSFLDGGGNDVYYAYGYSFGFSTASSFVDLGGADSYPTSAFGSYGYSQAVFYDTENPTGTQARNGHLSVNGMATNVPVNVPSPVKPVLDSMAGRVSASLTLAPSVGSVGRPVTLALRVNTEIPAQVYVLDDQGAEFVLDPPGTVPGLDGIYFTAGSDETLAATYVPTQSGTRTFYVHLRDPHAINRFQTVVAGPFSVDAQPPVIALTFWDGADSNALSSYHSESNPVGGANVSATDVGAGLGAIYIKEGSDPVPGIDAPAWAATLAADGRGPTASPKQFVGLGGLAEGTHDFNVLVVDAVGNPASSDFAIKIDRSVPSFSAALAGGTQSSTGWYTAPPRPEVTLGDAVSGVSRVEYQWSGATSTSVTSVSVGSSGGENRTLDLTPLNGFSDGESSVEVTVYDASHKANTAGGKGLLSFKIDDTAPKTTDNVAPTGTKYPPLPIALSAVDDGSGIDKTLYKSWKSSQAEPAAFSLGNTFTIPKAGDWTVRYYSVDKAGNTEPTITKTVSVTTIPPTVAFVADPENVFAATPMRLLDASTDADGTLVSWRWDLGDGTSASGPSVEHIYADSGVYLVTLTVTDDDGAARSLTKALTVLNKPPSAQFVSSTLLQRAGRSVNFLDRSEDLDGIIASRVWTFGDGASETGTSPTHIFQNPGTYTVILTVTDDDGDSVSASKQIQVLANLPPVADFEGPAAGLSRLTDVDFVDKSTDDVSVAAWTWNFGDGTTSTSKDPNHRFPGEGVYNVSLTVTDDEGASTTLVKQVPVGLVVPQAQIQASTTDPKTGEMISLSATANEDESRIVAWSWDFDDGASASTRLANKTYATPGLRVIKLHVRNADGGELTTSQAVTVHNRPPLGGFSFTPSAPVYSSDVQFRDASKDPDGPVRSWMWSFGDGDTSQEQNPSHRYAAPGTFAVELAVTDGEGLRGTVRRDVKVDPIPPKPEFLPSVETPKTGENVRFFDYSADPDRGALSYVWEFGDGSASNEREPEHAYEAAGVFKVRLTVTDDHGAVRSVEKVLAVAPAASAIPIVPSTPATAPAASASAPSGTASAGPSDASSAVPNAEEKGGNASAAAFGAVMFALGCALGLSRRRRDR